jgi:hypothetical protein
VLSAFGAFQSIIGGGHDERDLDCIPAVRLSSDLIASADRD